MASPRSTTGRLTRPGRAAALSALAAAVLTAGACTPAGGGGEGVDQGRIVDEMASHVDEGTTRSYTATYSMTGGVQVTIAHTPDPSRDGYFFSEGDSYVSTPEYEMVCEDGACTLRDPRDPTAPLDSERIESIAGDGFISTQDVLGLLTRASLDNHAAIEQSDSTLVGEHAGCAEVTGLTGADATDFKACVTTRGVLGSFKGRVNGENIEVLLVSYSESVDEATFAVPEDASVTDDRGE